jgi:hypothetical protein
MSLINEALKRTQDASCRPVTVSPTAVPSYRASDRVAASGSKGTLLLTVLIVAIAVAAAVKLTLQLSPRVQTLQNNLGTGTEATPSVPEVKPAESPARPFLKPPPPEKVEAPSAEPSPSTSAVDPKAGEDELVARVMERIKAEQAAAPAPPEPPKFVLQGITSAKDGSEAMINGLTVREGEEIEGARVAAIDHRTVKLDWNGREIVLRLP